MAGKKEPSKHYTLPHKFNQARYEEGLRLLSECLDQIQVKPAKAG